MQGLPQVGGAGSGFGTRDTEGGCTSGSVGPPGDTCLGKSLERLNSRVGICGITCLFVCLLINEFPH